MVGFHYNFGWCVKNLYLNNKTTNETIEIGPKILMKFFKKCLINNHHCSRTYV